MSCWNPAENVKKTLELLDQYHRWFMQNERYYHAAQVESAYLTILLQDREEGWDA